MELCTVMRTNPACRVFSPAPVPKQLLLEAMEMARFGPSGGNRQGARFVAVYDADKRKQLGEWFRVPTLRNLEEVKRGRAASVGPTTAAMRVGQGGERMLRMSERFAHHFHETPVVVVACIDLDSILFTDEALDRVSIVGGASIYPIVQNFMLALRDQGVASCLTTILCEYEPEIKKMLGIPDNFATACHIAVGYPANGFPTKLVRADAGDLIFGDTFGERL
jgi:nitroreductase